MFSYTAYRFWQVNEYSVFFSHQLYGNPNKSVRELKENNWISKLEKIISTY